MTREELCALLKRFRESRPRTVTSKVEKTNIGIGMVLRYLEEAGRPVSAGEISRFMSVSTARVAVLLRTMSAKGLIDKSEDSADARKVCVSLSEGGRESVRQMTEELIGIMAEIVEKIGAERIGEYLDTADRINAVVAGMLIKQGQLCPARP